MQYRYVAYNLEDGVIKGLLEAKDEGEARSEVASKGYNTLEIRPARRLPAPEELFPSMYQVGSRDLVRFLRQLATMLGSGASVQRTLEMIQEGHRHRMMRMVLGKVRAALDEGSTLSDALAEHPAVFDPVFLSVIRVGESTGRLGPALEQLADILEKEQEAKSTVMRTMMMPMVNLAAAVIMLMIMVTVVLPPIFETFENGGSEIPLMMRIVMGISNAITQNAVYIGLGAVALLPAWALLKRIEGVRYRLDSAKARLPVFGSLIIATQIAAFSRTVGILLNSGVPFADALNLATGGVKNLVLRRAFIDAEESLLSGHGVAETLKRHHVVPSIWVELVMIGEQSNSLERVMNGLADSYQKQAENHLGSVLAVLEPLSTLAVGGVVAFLALSNVQMVQSSLSSLGQ